MIVQFIKIETTLTLEEVEAVAKARKPQFEAVPGLVQKFYLKLDKPNHYGGFNVWRSREDLEAFRATDLARTIAASYRAIGTPEVEIHEVLFPLRDMATFEAVTEAA
ncbi:MAG: hypothetical protein LJE62_01515 [Silicimonas sp.]|jgi:heme-degrading monooxygenase HmoA|nr:hypothetical protein [Silicimonas sp.]